MKGLPPLAAANAAAVSPRPPLDGAGLPARGHASAKSGATRPQGETLRRLALPATLFSVAGLLLYGVGLSPCPMAFVFHLPCPGCGITRAARAAFHGHFAEATHLHPLWFILIPLGSWAFAYEMYKYVRTGRLGNVERLRYATSVTTVLVVLLIAVWLARFAGAFGGSVSV